MHVRQKFGIKERVWIITNYFEKMDKDWSLDVRIRKFIAKLIILFLILHVSLLMAEPLTIIYSGNLDGELEPCGCSEAGDLGGIKRRASYLDQQKKQNPNLVTLSSGGLLASDGPDDRLKSQFILQGFALLKYDAIGLQWRDLVYGDAFLGPDELPWIASNWNNTTFQHKKIIKRSINKRDYSLAVFTWLDPDRSPMRQMQGEHRLVNDQHSALLSQIKKAKQQGNITILTTTQDLQTIQQQISLQDIDILLVKSAYEEFGKPQKIKNTLVLQPGSRGMRVARLELVIDEKNRIKSWQENVIPLPDTIADAPRFNAWYAKYNEQVKQEYLRRTAIEKKLRSGESDYVGEEQCKMCHAKQHKIWSDSQHAIAFEDLEAANKSFDSSCIVCHTVGFNQPGGFLDIDITANLLGVQCESCHGASRAHVKSGGQKPVKNIKWDKQKICAQCHTQPHSPLFSVEKYWPKIAH